MVERRKKSAGIRLNNNNNKEFVCHKINHMRIPQLTLPSTMCRKTKKNKKRGTAEKYNVELHASRHDFNFTTFITCFSIYAIPHVFLITLQYS